MYKLEQDSLENQIGDLGSSENTEQVPPLAGQKLKKVKVNKGLAEEDEQSMKEFLDKTEGTKTRVFQSGQRLIGSQPEGFEGEALISNGWIPVSREGLKDRGIFYPMEWQFRIKPVKTDTAVKWSSIDTKKQDYQIQIWNVMQEIVKQSVKIETPTGPLNWTRINSWDRFWFIMRVHDISYAKSSKIEFTDECESCGEETTFCLETDKLAFDMPDSDIVDKYWSQNEQCWKIDPSEYDMPGSIIKLYPKTMGKDDVIVKWAYAQAQMGKTTDEDFIKVLPWLMKSSPSDLKLADKMIKDIQREYKNWAGEMKVFMDEIIRNVDVTPEEKIMVICPSCGLEVRSSLQFQNGVKSLFPVETRHKKFGTK